MRPNKGLLLIALVLILTLSLTTIWSTVPNLFLTQLTFIIVGIIIVYLFSKTDVTILFSLSTVFYVSSVVLLLITLVIGRNIRGSVRWIDLGFFPMQTSEIVKPLLAVFYSSYLSRLKKIGWSQLFIFLGLAVLPVILIAIQPDLGSALTLSFLAIMLLVFFGQFKKLLLLGGLLLLIVLPLESRLLKPYQRQRLETFINPYTDPQGAGYNVIQATIAVGSGSIVGKGVKLGTQSHLNFLPERHTDFIFASFVEEFGLVGAATILLSYYVIFHYCLLGIRLLRNGQESTLCLSIFLLFFFQSAVNIGMNLGIMPVTGITLPLFSYGGSSFISFSILIGLLIRELDLITPFRI